MPILRWLRRHPVLAVFLVGVSVATGFGLDWWYLPSRPTTDPTRVVRLEIAFDEWTDQHGKTDQPPARHSKVALSTTDPAKVAAVLNVFRHAQRAEEHKCGTVGLLTIHRKNGSVQQVKVLPGHDRAYYEYRFGSRINRLPRDEFFAAMAEMGVDQINPGWLPDDS